MNLGIYDITIDFSKLLVHNSTSIYFKEGDLNTACVRAKLTMQGKVIDLSECNAILRVETLTGEKINDNATVIDPVNGIVEINFKSNTLIKGTNFFELIIIKGESAKKSPKLAYRVLDSIDDTGSVEGANEYPILISLIADVNIAINKAEQAYSKATSIHNELGTVLDNVNNVINATNSAKDKALNAVDNVNKAIAAGTHDLEVKEARGGYISLNERLVNLDKDLLKTKEISSLVSTDSSFLNIKGTINGYLEDIKLEGKTLVNTFEYSSDSTSGNIIEIISKDYQNKTLGKVITVVNSYSKTIYANTYTQAGAFVSSVPIPGNSSKVFDGINNLYNIIGYISDGWTVDTLKKNTLWIVGNHPNLNIGYFEGMKSVGDGTNEIVVSSVNSNAFNEDLLSSRLESDGYYHFRTSGNTVGNFFLGFLNGESQWIGKGVTPNVVENFTNIDMENVKLVIGINGDKKDDKSVIPVTDLGYLSTYFFKGCEIVKVDPNHIKIRNMELSYGKTSPSYVPHKTDKKKVLFLDTIDNTWKKPTLREWDSIEKHINGKYYYHRRNWEMVLDGSQDAYLGTVVSDTTSFAIKIPKTAPSNSIAAICDKISVNLECYNQAIEGLFYSGDNITLRLKTSKASTVETLKTYLDTNPIKIVYKTVREEIYECTPVDLISFENETIYMFKGGYIIPRTTLKVQSYIGNIVNMLKEKVSLLEDKLYKTNLANFTVALNTLDAKLRLDNMSKTPL